MAVGKATGQIGHEHVLAEPLVIALLAGCGMTEEKARVLELVLHDLGPQALDRDVTRWSGAERRSPPAALRGRLDRCLRMEETLLVEGLLRLDGMASVSSRLVLVPLELVGLRTGLAELRDVSGHSFRSIHGELPALAAQWGVGGGQGSGCLRLGDAGHGRCVALEHDRVALSHPDAEVDELLRQILDGVVVERELAAQRAEGEAASLLKQRTGAIDDLEKAGQRAPGVEEW